MPHVTVYYKMYLPGGHHRQPRNADAELILAPTAGSDVPNPGSYTPPFFPQLPYDLNGPGLAKLLFWNVTDGTTGQVLPPAQFDQAVGAFPLTITGWYYPISGPAVGEGGSAIIDDAFSAALGKFIDDTFVTVTSNNSLTSDANVIGVVPTSSAVTLEAKLAVPSTPEPFRQWILNDSIMAVDQKTLNVPKGTNGIAIAIYQLGNRVVVRPDPKQYVAGPALVLGGVTVDGGGIVIIGGKPHPVDPWGPLFDRLAQSATVAASAAELEKKAGAEVLRVAAKDALGALKAATAAFQKLAR